MCSTQWIIYWQQADQRARFRSLWSQGDKRRTIVIFTRRLTRISQPSRDDVAIIMARLHLKGSRKFLKVFFFFLDWGWTSLQITVQMGKVSKEAVVNYVRLLYHHKMQFQKVGQCCGRLPSAHVRQSCIFDASLSHTVVSQGAARCCFSEGDVERATSATLSWCSLSGFCVFVITSEEADKLLHCSKTTPRGKTRFCIGSNRSHL